MRFAQGVAALGLVAVIALLVIFTELSIADMFASLLAIIPTGWAILCAVSYSHGTLDNVEEIALRIRAVEKFRVKVSFPCAFGAHFLH
ncbi:hypothetical protein C1H46_003915 [Malus baccata]|uniref:Uncharacterized protein n=1 Tax=Malus baccata TaxID=106549 RepID=A0A540NIZ8_MALBA|nr:hypothetical protein C1H46_003915 [Malus baccata]